MTLNPFKIIGKATSGTVNITERVPGWISGATRFMIRSTGEGYRETRKPVPKDAIVTNQAVDHVKAELKRTLGSDNTDQR